MVGADPMRGREGAPRHQLILRDISREISSRVKAGTGRSVGLQLLISGKGS